MSTRDNGTRTLAEKIADMQKWREANPQAVAEEPARLRTVSAMFERLHL